MRKKFKRIGIIILAAMLVAGMFSWSALAADEADYGNYIRMQLGTMGTPSSVAITINGNYYIQEAPTRELTTGSSYTFKASGGKIYLVTSSGDVALGTSAKLVRCKTSETKNYLTLTNIKYNAATNYPGDMTMTASGSTMTMICRMYIEDYLQGVLAAEMDNGWELEALKAQAVASRTFALSKTTTGKNYDLTDLSSSYQAFRRYSVSNGKIIAAVEATRGQVLYWNGKLSDGLYSACNGGQTLPASLKWNMSDTYHTMKDDPYDGLTSKAVSYTYTFYKEGKGTTDSRSTKQIISAAAKALDADSDSIEVLGITSVTPYGHPNGHPETSKVFTKFKLGVVLSVNGERTETELDFTYTSFRSAFESDYSLLSAMRSVLEVTETENTFVMTARGWGHSVGMSQAGAQGMATLEKTYLDILDFYYNGCTVETLTQKTNTLPSLPNSSNEIADGLDVVGYGLASSTERVKVYQSGSIGSTVRGSLEYNQVVKVFEKGSSFTKIYYKDYVGYVVAGKLTVTDTNPLEQVTAAGKVNTTGGTLKLRAQANTSSNVLNSLANGTALKIIAKEGSWYKVAYGEQIGYASTNYVTVTGSVTPTPTASIAPTASASPTASTAPTASASPAAATTPVNYIATGTVATSGGALTVRKGPGTEYSKIGTLAKGATVEILEKGSWLKIKYGSGIGYVSAKYVAVKDLATPTPSASPTPTPTAAVTPSASASPTASVTPSVTSAPVNYVAIGLVNTRSGSLTVRSGAGTGYSKIGSLTKGISVQIVEKGSKWHKIHYGSGIGYVSASYIKITSEVTPTASTSPTASTAPVVSPLTSPSPASGIKGIVKVSGSLNVRQGAGTSYKSVGTLKNGTIVTILEKGSAWHKISTGSVVGYVSAKYITITGASATASPAATATANLSAAVIATGKVKVSGSLNVREGAGTNYKSLGSLSNGATVQILEKGSKWIKIVYGSGVGYVSASYVTIAAATPTPIATSTALSGKIIGLDPGHQSKANDDTEANAPGSTDMKAKCSSGVQGVSTKTWEYAINLNVAKLLKKMLEANGATVVMTRTTNDVDLSNVQRAQIFNEAQVDLGICLHCNGSTNTSRKGAFMLIPEDTALSKTEEAVATTILASYCQATGMNNLGITPRDDQTGFNWCERMIICIEMGHLSNADEDVLLSSEAFQWKMAYGLLQGILAYYK